MAAAKMTQVECANKIGVAHTQIGRWMRDENEIPQPAAMALAQIFHVRWEWLKMGDGKMLLEDMGNLSPEEVRLIEIYRHLDMAGRNDLLVNAAIVQGMMERRLDRRAGKK